MKIPKIVKKDRKKYMFEKRYTNFYLYSDTETKVKRCFTKFDLGLIDNKEINVEKYNHLNRSNYNKDLCKTEL